MDLRSGVMKIYKEEIKLENYFVKYQPHWQIFTVVSDVNHRLPNEYGRFSE